MALGQFAEIHELAVAPNDGHLVGAIQAIAGDVAAVIDSDSHAGVATGQDAEVGDSVTWLCEC